jgi:hypothetical protein
MDALRLARQQLSNLSLRLHRLSLCANPLNCFSPDS